MPLASPSLPLLAGPTTASFQDPAPLAAARLDQSSSGSIGASQVESPALGQVHSVTS